VLSGVLLTLAVLGVVLVLLGIFCKVWLGSRGFIAERVRTELTQREAERQIQHIAYAAMQQMLDEARRSGSSPASRS
jgi:hypothetical protein